jgi:hypothetical protein
MPFAMRLWCDHGETMSHISSVDDLQTARPRGDPAVRNPRSASGRRIGNLGLAPAALVPPRFAASVTGLLLHRAAICRMILRPAAVTAAALAHLTKAPRPVFALCPPGMRRDVLASRISELPCLRALVHRIF